MPNVQIGTDVATNLRAFRRLARLLLLPALFFLTEEGRSRERAMTTSAMAAGTRYEKRHASLPRYGSVTKGNMVPRLKAAPCMPCACAIFSGGAIMAVTLTPARNRTPELKPAQKRRAVASDGDQETTIDTKFVEDKACGQLNKAVRPQES